ncbi:hypothetical protein COO91_03473 [Nostoc flagelliforme CCNUN1]|uniref:Uncharacterized protein n=1 Tax=Nostoc flagelliforme CCNUN1 TaxID=2038116 RepID=A0A2K8SQ48_9NOSO|nr:hypothetical protein [Nostoc flagelliforme]AUB37528.1 hypothetical protein COO91_03473 [Nostoc flagelliforme CCNUN1]
MHEVELLRQQSQMNRSQYESNAADINSDESVAAKYLGYDPNLRLAKLQDAEGNIFYGKADTNGAIARGEDIRLRRGYGIPGYDAMPHVEQKPIDDPSKNLTVIKTDLLYYLEIEKNETTAPNISGEWSFFGGRCRPRFSSFSPGSDIYESLEECQSNNSIISAISPLPEDSVRYRYSYTADVGGISFRFSTGPTNFERSYLVFYIDTYSSYQSTVYLQSSVTVQGGGFLQAGILPRGEIFNSQDIFLQAQTGYGFVDSLRGNYLRFDNTLNFDTSVAVLSASDIGNNTVVSAGMNRIIVVLLANVARVDRPISIFGRINVTWNPTPEPVLVGDFYLRKQQNNQAKDIQLGEICLAGGIAYYLSQTPQKTFANIFVLEQEINELAQYRFLQKFVIEQAEVTISSYKNPEIPIEEEDWLQPVYDYKLSLFMPANIRVALTVLGLCLKLPFYIANFNFYKNTFYKIDLYEEQEGVQIQELLRTQPVTIQMKISQLSIDVESNSCSIIKETPKTIKLLTIGDEKARVVAASSLIFKKKYVGN